MNRKLTLALVILIVFCVAAIYIAIPRTMVISTIEPVRCNSSGAARVLSREDLWTKILGREDVGGYTIGVRGKGFHEVGLGLFAGEDSATGKMGLLSLGNFDSVALRWDCDYETGVWPVARVRGYFRAKRLLKAMDSVTLRLKDWLEHTENIYGIKMVDSMSGISNLVLIRKWTPAYPSVEDVYERVHALRNYVVSQGAKETDYPMFHVSEKTDKGYESMVGIPVDTILKATAQIEPKRYVPWKVMTGKVVGGPQQAERGMLLLQQYVTDHQKPAMGLPFQSLVTERDKEADTTKWVTWVVQAVP
jgi:hypothetical protein